MMSDICLFLGNEDVHTANTYTQRQYYEVQVVFWVMLRSTPLQYTKYTPGKGGYVVFWEKHEVLRPAPLPPKTGHPQACPTRVVIDTDRSTRGAEKQQSNNSSPCITGTSTRTSTWFVSDRYLLCLLYTSPSPRDS